ncbi:MAG: potassium transporter [Candidatus Competibacteraceae bacterium]|nr:potassium transporter [Candidatus Competibacteraceae bacterium]
MVGLLLMLFGATMLPPMAVAWWYDGYAMMLPFAETLGATLGLGLLCWTPLYRFKVELRNRDGFVLVVAFWFLSSLLGALPFLLSDHPQVRFVDAVFETVSGLTTTGASVLSGLDHLPKAILYYRAQLHFLGGIGIVVLAVALLPMLGVGGMQLYRASTPGPMKDEKLTPRITETAKNLWYIYVGLNLLCFLAYWSAGMSPFDAICYSFTTIALGGLAPHDASIGHFQSPLIEWITVFFMLVAMVNFALFFLAWRARSFKAVYRDPEFRFCMQVVALIVGLAALHLYLNGESGWASVHRGVFQGVSIISGTGLVTAGYPIHESWPAFVPLLLLLGSFFGGCVGSTCGGIKAIRFLLLYKQSVREMRLLVRPSAQIAVKLGDHPIPQQIMQAVWGFYYLYIFSYCAFSLALAYTGVDLVTAFGTVAACLNNMGVGLGETAVGFNVLNDAATWLMSLAMLMGRLEVFPLLLMFLPDFWK